MPDFNVPVRVTVTIEIRSRQLAKRFASRMYDTLYSIEGDDLPTFDNLSMSALVARSLNRQLDPFFDLSRLKNELALHDEDGFVWFGESIEN